MRSTATTVLVLLAAAALGGCGDGDEPLARTGPGPGAGTPAATATTPVVTDPQAAPPTVQPAGAIAAEGTYAMRAGEQRGDWRLSTLCDGTRCALALRRGQESLTLAPVPGRAGVFTGAAKCRRYAVRLSDPVEAGGRRTARRVEATVTDGCGGSARRAVTWRGSLTSAGATGGGP